MLMISNPDTSTPSVQMTVPKIAPNHPDEEWQSQNAPPGHCDSAACIFWSPALEKKRPIRIKRETHGGGLFSFSCNRTAGTPGSSLGCITEIKSYPTCTRKLATSNHSKPSPVLISRAFLAEPHKWRSAEQTVGPTLKALRTLVAECSASGL